MTLALLAVRVLDIIPYSDPHLPFLVALTHMVSFVSQQALMTLPGAYDRVRWLLFGGLTVSYLTLYPYHQG